jgi:hypothetical protein
MAQRYVMTDKARLAASRTRELELRTQLRIARNASKRNAKLAAERADMIHLLRQQIKREPLGAARDPK